MHKEFAIITEFNKLLKQVSGIVKYDKSFCKKVFEEYLVL